jgi:hypothetical protein
MLLQLRFVLRHHVVCFGMVCEMTALNYLLVVCGFRPNPKFMFLPFLVERSTDKTSQALHKQHTGTDNTTKTDNKSLPKPISAITDHDVTRQLFRLSNVS